MPSYTWNAPTGGNWNTQADWTPARIPIAQDRATFATGGNSYTVDGNATVEGIAINADAVTFTGALTIGAGGLNATGGAIVDLAAFARVTDSASPDFAPGTLLEVDGTLKTVGAIADVVLVTGAGAGWTTSEPAVLNQLYVNQGATFAGDVALGDGGTVNLDTSATFSGTITLAGNGTLYVADAVDAPAGAYMLSDAITVTAGHVLSLGDDPGVSVSVTGGIAGGGAVAVLNADMTFADPNTYTGGTSVVDATLTLVGAGAAGTGAIFLDDGTLNLQADSTGGAGSETVVAAGGTDVVDDTIAAASGSLLVFGAASGTLSFAGGGGPATVVGGAGGVLDATGGAGPDVFYAGASGMDRLTSGTGPATLASAYGGTLTAVGAAANLLVAAGGNATLAGVGSTGANLYFTSGTGTTVVEAGAGASTVVAGGALNDIFGATGTQDVFLSGGGVSQFDFVSGFGGGTTDIIGFGAGDTLHLTGYADGAAQAALDSATVSGGNTALVLPDDTRIVLFGFTGVTAATFG